jgi:hypothetical protein
MNNYTPDEKEFIMRRVASELSKDASVDALVAHYNAYSPMWKERNAEDFKEYIRDYSFMVIVENEFGKYEPDAGDFFHNDQIMTDFNRMLDKAFDIVYPKFLIKIGK